MKTRARILLTLLLLTCVVFAGRGNAQDNMGRYIVTVEGPPGPAEQAVIRAGGVVNHVYTIIPAIAIQIPEAALPGLRQNPDVVLIEPDAFVTALPKPPSPPGKDKEPPTPPAQTLPWGVDRIDAEYAWISSKGAGSNVAIIDTGIDKDHLDLAVVGGINYVATGKGPPWKRTVDPQAYDDDNGHGTHSAGIIAALNNDIGVVGVAPEASLYAVKALDSSGSGYVSDIIAGIQWCVTNGMDIANMSLGADDDVQAFHDACDTARAAGVLLVAAAGNDGGAVDYPAAYSSVIAVSAADSSDKIAYFSSRGPEIEIAAPGVSIYSTYAGGGYETLSGTSMAAPHVTGTLALNLSVETLLGTADFLHGFTAEEQGAGLVDAEEAVIGSQGGDN